MNAPAHRRVTPRLGAALIPAAGLATGILLAALLPSQMASAAPSVVAKDSFARTAASSWGSAPSGGSYSLSKSGTTKFSVASGRGSISGLGKGVSTTATLSSVKVQDVDVTATIGLPKTAASLYSAFELRHQTDGSRYRGRLIVGTSGTATLALTRINKKTEVELARSVLPFKVAPGQSVHLDFQAVGTTKVALSGRAWLSGSSTPAWKLTYNDSSSARLSAAGTIGYWVYSGAANASALTTTLDDLAVTKDPTASAASTPKPTPTPSSTTPAPTPAPAPPTETAPVPATDSSQRGSAPIGSTAYPIPSGAIFVSPTGSDSGTGSVSSPLRTVTNAVNRAPDGTTIVLRGGTYNQTVSVPINKSGLTFQPYPHEAVWFDGSQRVTSWTKTGDTWTTKWDYFPSNKFLGVADNPRFVSADHPLAARADLAFSDGSQLTQVANAAAVKAGTFAADPGAGTVTVGADPSTHEIRLSNLGQAFWVFGAKTTLQGFGVQRYASNPDTTGAIRLSNINSTARNIEINDTGDIGISLSNNGGTIDHITVRRAGQLGVNVNASYGFKLTNSVIDDNNYSWFKPEPVSGGVKITRSRGVTVSNNEVNGNNSNGIWCDESCYDVVVANNTVQDNFKVGINIELSQKVVVANNKVARQDTNIEIQNTGDARVFNNSIEGGRTFGVMLRQDARLQSNPNVAGHDPRQPNPDTTVPWITKNVVISNNAFGASTGYQIYGLDMAHMGVTITGNMFNRRVTTAQSTLVAYGLYPNSGEYVHYQSPEALSANVNVSWVNLQTPNVLGISAMSTLLGSAASSIAVPLPSDIATMIDEKAGAKKIGAF